MNIPKIIFKKMTLEENIEIIKWSFFENNGELSVHDYTIEYYPELSSIDNNLPKEEIYKIISDVVTKDYYKYESRIEEEVIRYNNIWSSYNDIYFNNLSNYFKCEFPDSVKEIKATVGLIPIFPRYLSTYSFSIATGVDEEKLIKTSAHETLHFMWFLKWKELYPETPSRHFDSPYLEWKYSEMVTDPILNNKPFSNIFNFTERGYDSFYELHDGNELVMDKLRNIYSTYDDINIKIVNGFNYIKEYFKGE